MYITIQVSNEVSSFFAFHTEKHYMIWFPGIFGSGFDESDGFFHFYDLLLTPQYEWGVYHQYRASICSAHTYMAQTVQYAHAIRISLCYYAFQIFGFRNTFWVHFDTCSKCLNLQTPV